MPETRLTSGVFPVPQPEGSDGVALAVLINSTLPEESAAQVRVQRITPQGEKETLYESSVTVPAHGGRHIALDPEAVAGQMLEVHLVLPREGLQPSVALITGTAGEGGADNRSLALWVSPRDFVALSSTSEDGRPDRGESPDRPGSPDDEAPAGRDDEGSPHESPDRPDAPGDPPAPPLQLTTGLFPIDDQRDNPSADWTYTLTLWVSHFGREPASLPFAVRSAREVWGLMGPIPLGEGHLNPPPGGAASFSMEAPQGGILEVNVDAGAGLVPSVVVARRMPGSAHQVRLWISPGRFTHRPGSLGLSRQPEPRWLLKTGATLAPAEAVVVSTSTPVAAPALTPAVPPLESPPALSSPPAPQQGSPSPPARQSSRRFGRGR